MCVTAYLSDPEQGLSLNFLLRLGNLVPVESIPDLKITSIAPASQIAMLIHDIMVIIISYNRRLDKDLCLLERAVFADHSSGNPHRYQERLQMLGWISILAHSRSWISCGVRCDGSCHKTCLFCSLTAARKCHCVMVDWF